MKHFFVETKTNKESWTPEALDFGRTINQALRPIFKEAKKNGYSLRELAYIVSMEVVDIHCASLIGWDEPQKPERKKS